MKNIFLKMTVIIIVTMFVILTDVSKVYGINQRSSLSLESFTKSVSIGSEMKICYFRTEELYKKLKQMKEIKDKLKAFESKLEKRLNAKKEQIDRWQEKWKKLGPLLSSEQIKYNEEANRIQQDYDQFLIQIETELMNKEKDLMMKLTKNIERAAEIYAIENGFDFVLSYETGGVYFGSNKYDITNNLIEIMNNNYKP